MAAVDAWKTHVLSAGDERLRIPGFRLKVTKGPDKGAEILSTSAELCVGTQAGADLVLTDPTVSRNHFSIEATPAGFRLRDHGSTNGTWVAGVRLVEAFVRPGCDVEVGGTVLRFTAKEDAVDLPLYPSDHFGALLGQSEVMRELFARLSRAAATDSTVLIQGETGTGKDLAAEAVHLASRRAQAPFVVLDCSAIPAALIESELFGHERGAFTGATERRVGAFESAHKGSIFLDEIGELPLALQPKLLRVIEQQVVRPVGASHAAGRKIDVRVIAATNRDLRAEVNRGSFREDLFFRLSVVPIRMPPLRDRGDDLLRLATAFYRELGGGEALPSELATRLRAHSWPGNVRELRNAVEQTLAIGELTLAESPAAESGAARVEIDLELPFKEAKRRLIERFERPYLEQLLAAEGGNVSAAARRTGLDRVHLIKLLRHHGLK